MTSSLQEHYAELIALTQLHLLQEFALSERRATDLESFEYFKQYAIQKKTDAAVGPPPQTAQRHIPPPPSLPSAAAAPKQPPQPQPQPVTTPPKPAAALKKEKASPETPKVSSTTAFQLDPLARPSEVEFGDIRKIVTERFPGQAIINDIPSDAEAKAINEAWRNDTVIPEILILSFEESPIQHAFLQNICKAISIRFGAAGLIRADKLSQEKGWESVLQTKSLKLIISSSHGLHGTPELLKHYKEAAKQAKHFLGPVPLFLLSDLAIYLKNPHLKATLWKDFCEALEK